MLHLDAEGDTPLPGRPPGQRGGEPPSRRRRGLTQQVRAKVAEPGLLDGMDYSGLSGR